MRHRHRDVRVNVVPLAAEDRIRANPHLDQQIPGRPSPRAGATELPQAKDRPGLRALGNADAERARPVHGAGAVAVGTLLGRVHAGAVAGRAGTRDGEELALVPGLPGHSPAAVAGRTARMVPQRAPPAASAGKRRHLKGRPTPSPERRHAEVDLEFDLGILPGASRAARAVEALAELTAEDVAEAA